MNLKKSNKSLGMSNILGCSFWETKYPDMYLTDYDINEHKSLKENSIYLLFKGIVYMYVSSEVTQIDEELNLFIEEFNKFIYDSQKH